MSRPAPHPRIFAARRALALATIALLSAGALFAQEPGEPEPSPAFKAQCEAKLPATGIDVQSLPSTVEYDFTKDIVWLTTTSKEPIVGNFTLGLTQNALSIQFKWGGTMMQDGPSKLYCIRPQITFKLSVGPQRVYVAKEFPRDTCTFDEIVKHELRHVRVNQGFVERVADSLRTELTESFGQRVFYGSAPALRSALNDNLEQGWVVWAQNRFADVKALHRQIDTPEEYARNDVMCGGVVPKTVAEEGLRPAP